MVKSSELLNVFVALLFRGVASMSGRAISISCVGGQLIGRSLRAALNRIVCHVRASRRVLRLSIISDFRLDST
jgi:hypothetical protein